MIEALTPFNRTLRIKICKNNARSRHFLRIAKGLPGALEKNQTDLKNYDGSCFIFIIKRLSLLKSAIIRINFDTFSSIFGD